MDTQEKREYTMDELFEMLGDFYSSDRIKYVYYKLCNDIEQAKYYKQLLEEEDQKMEKKLSQLNKKNQCE